MQEFKTAKERLEHLLRDETMKGIHLGVCIDSCRWERTGEPATKSDVSDEFIYDLTIKQMTRLIGGWLQQNGTSAALFFNPSRSTRYNEFELPYEPADPQIIPLETMLRRLNTRREYELAECENPLYCDFPEEMEHVVNEMHWLSLSERLKRKEFYMSTKACAGHIRRSKSIEFPFDGDILARYVKKWVDQVPNGQMPIFERD